MIVSNRRNSKIQVDPRGKIKTGAKGVSLTGREIPKALDHFNIEMFPELKAMYGEVPAEIVIAVPSDNIPDFYDDRFALYGSNNQAIRRCDGETCIHRIPEQLMGQAYVPGQESECLCLTHGLFETDDKELRKKCCGYTMNLKAFICDPKDGTIKSTIPYLFETGSRNSGSAVYSALTNLAGLTTLFFGQPKLAFLPMRLWVKMVSGKEDAKLKFPIWELTPPTDISVIIERLMKVGKALGWDEDLMKRIDSSRQLQSGETIPQDVRAKIAADILAATQKSLLVGIGNQINELDGYGLTSEEAEELRRLTKSRWATLGFDKQGVAPATTREMLDVNNPLGLP